jgi:fructose-1,6-bisphosphatase II
MLYNGEQVGDGTGPECDVAVDPIDGTTLMTPRACPTRSRCSRWPSGARCSTPAPCSTWRSWSPGPRRPGAIDITAPVRQNVRRWPGPRADRRQRGHGRASWTGRGTTSWCARSARPGARIKFISDGDVAGAIMAVRPKAPAWTCCSASAARRRASSRRPALKCLGGVIQGKLWPKDDAERQKALDAGHDLDRVLTTDDLVTGDNVFFVRDRDHRRRAAARRALPLGRRGDDLGTNYGTAGELAPNRSCGSG